MSAAGFSLKEAPIGAEVVGLTYQDDYDQATKDALYSAWLDNGLLLFRNVKTVEQHISLSRCFGELEPHPIVERRSKEYPVMLELGGPRSSRAWVYNEADIKINRVPWHRDTAYTRDICKGAMLRLLELPAHEGETMFSDTARAYDNLPDDVKKRLEGLEYRTLFRTEPVVLRRHGAFWNKARWATDEEDPEGAGFTTGTLASRYPAVIHPAVLPHPESGRKAIFLSPKEFDCFLGMSRSESDDLVDYLMDHLLQPAYTYKHDWKKDEALLWDNRRIMHAAAGNPIDEPRWGLRTTLAGPVRTGRYAEEGVTGDSAPAY